MSEQKKAGGGLTRVTLEVANKGTLSKRRWLKNYWTKRLSVEITRPAMVKQVISGRKIQLLPALDECKLSSN